ncbi:unnamed protein product [Oikopleura dioica]|uniref:Uncharacterized protein n=1 Tax=Oikopleura dioica TaxID=34765 RepID=E4XU47_OIKDI|nr:unnamed protein product [Oikopleura dioica]
MPHYLKSLLKSSFQLKYFAREPDKCVSTKAGELLSMQIQAAGFAECSALTNDGVERVFQMATTSALMGKKGMKKKSRCILS